MIALLPGGHAAKSIRQHGRHSQQDTANAFQVRATNNFFNLQAVNDPPIPGATDLESATWPCFDQRHGHP
jgi:hypothetical protein